ncbi:hypothetical protein [Hyalangium rubrum]|uniref:VCBS repeat-containing protein n=1 Tax=Hyalangium rubrum TaxID=3103134 RepID=A0ABU5H3C1_9BACT|nr:hypothetical protein [Hyalangium sp. s54d21]MDY7227959.1 hypothetical protein [Hyalangium sp. s54d21]
MKAFVPVLLGLCLLGATAQAKPAKQRKPTSRDLAKVKELLTGRELVPKKTFQVALKGAGTCLFAPAMDYKVSPPLQLHLIQGGQIAHTLASTKADKAWPVLRFENVQFQDVNEDGFEDVLTLTRYLPVVGPRAGKAFNQAGVYLSKQGKAFELAPPEVHETLNQSPPSSLGEVVKRLKKVDRQKLAVPVQVSATPKP